MLKNYNIKASSLLESVMAIAIISFCLVIATMIYAQLYDSDYDMGFYKTKHKVSELHYQTIREQSFENENYKSEGGYRIEKTVEDYEEGVKRVQFKVTNDKRKELFVYLIKTKKVEAL